MKAELHLVLAVGVVLCLTTVANADVVFDDGEVHTIKDAIYGNVFVLDGPNGISTQVELVDDPTGTGSISEYLYCWDTSVVTLSGGTVGGNLEASGYSQVTVSGGTIGEDLGAYGYSEVSIWGGTIGGKLIAGGYGQITIYSEDFNYDYGELSDPDPDSDPIMGTLANGDEINNAFSIGSSARIILAPGSIINVAIDIKPGRYPNEINLGSHGLTPVAIFSKEAFDSEEGFDATSVELNTVNLAGAFVATRGKTGEKFMAHEEDVDGDGLVDLVVQVITADINPDLLQQDGDAIYAVLTGNTSDGGAIEGEDEIIIVPPK